MVTNDQEALAAKTDSSGDPGTSLERTERTATLCHRLAELPPRQQEVLRLKFQEEMSYRDIAELTGMTVNNVGVTLHTAMRKLRDQLPKGRQL